MSVLRNYILSQFWLPFIGSNLFFVCFLLAFQLMKILRLISNKSVAQGILLSLIGQTAITFLPLVVPLSVFFACMILSSKMSIDSEIIAMRAIGYSKRRILFSLLLPVFLIAGILYQLNSVIIPDAKKNFRHTLAMLGSSGFFSEIRPSTFYNQIPGLILFSEKIENKDQLVNLFIHMNKKNDNKIITAQRGFLKKDQVSEIGAANLSIVLQNGIINIKKDKTYDKIHFQEYALPLTSSFRLNKAHTKDNMRSSAEIWKLMKRDRKEQKRSFKDQIKSQIEFWQRINNPLLCIIFCFLGFSLGVKNMRGREKKSPLLTLFIIVLYYGVFFSGISMAKSGVIAPLLAIFLPSGLLFSVALYFFKKIEG